MGKQESNVSTTFEGASFNIGDHIIVKRSEMSTKMGQKCEQYAQLDESLTEARVNYSKLVVGKVTAVI